MNRKFLIALGSLLVFTSCGKTDEPKNKETVNELVATEPTEDETEKQEEALEKAKKLATEDKLSEGAIFNKLSSEGYSKNVVNYALNNIGEIDWDNNALAAAKKIKTQKPELTDEQIKSILTEKNGLFFSEAESFYAIEHLND